jgi:hypothetical protein
MSVTKVSAALMEAGTKGADIASADTMTIGTGGSYFDITGTTGISTINCAAGRIFTLQFDGAVTLTHSSSLYLNGAVNFTSEANDHLTFVAVAANDVRQIGAGLKDGGSPVAAGGDCVFLSSTTASAASSIDITSADGLDSSLYSHYGVYIGGVFPTTTMNDLVLRLSDDNGSSYDSDGYNYSSVGIDDSGSSGATATADGTYIRVVASAAENSSPYAVWGWVWIPVSAAADPVGAHVTWHTAGLDSAEDSWCNAGSGQQETAPDSGGWDAFQFIPHNAGNLTGTVYIYGFKKS